MQELPDELLELLPEDRDEAAQWVYASFFNFWDAQWEEGGMIYNAVSKAWKRGLGRGMVNTIDYYDKLTVLEPPKIPSREDAEWPEVLEAIHTTNVAAPITYKEAESLVGRKEKTIRNMASQLGMSLGNR